MTSGYQALHESCAWYDLSRRGKIYARGEDRARLLHAMTTNHVQQLKPGQGLYAFFLTPQGRILGDSDLLCLEDALLLDVEPETVEKLYQHIDKFIIADDVTLEDATEQWATLEIGGPHAADVLKKMGASVPDADHGFTLWDTEIVVNTTATGAPGYRILTPASEKVELVLAIESAGAVRADEEAWRVRRIEQGRPRYGEDILETNLPQETQVMRALHFQKGCYVGQEIVERVRSQGRVHRQLVPLSVDAATPPVAGTKIVSGDKEAGVITSAAFSPMLQQVAALGYVRAEFMTAGQQLEADGRAVMLRTVS